MGTSAAVDNAPFRRTLSEGCRRLGIAWEEDGVGPACARYFDLLMRWNRKVNLTAVTAPEEVAEKHFLDSLALLPDVATVSTLLDLGAGAGFPGLPLKLAKRDLTVELVEAVGKKVGFLKQVIAELGLGGARAVHLRAQGRPVEEGIGLAQRVTSRALGSLADVLPLARPYLAPGGAYLAMLGVADASEVEAQAAVAGWRLEALRTYALPFSGARRAVATLVPG